MSKPLFSLPIGSHRNVLKNWCISVLPVAVLGLSLGFGGCHNRVPVANKVRISSSVDDATRPITASDLISIRDIGASAFDDVISVSPDGAHVAFQVQQGDATLNEYRTGWFVTSTTAGGAVTSVGGGGDVMLHGEASGRIGGTRLTIQAKWSPDSEWIAYRLKLNGETQIWRSRRDGSLQEQLTRNAADVSDFTWSTDGSEVFFQVGRQRDATSKALQKEGQLGYLFDDRFLVSYATTPTFFDPGETNPFDPDHVSGLWVYEIESGQERVATEADLDAYLALTAAQKPKSVDKSRAVHSVVSFSKSGPVAWLENVEPGKYAGYQPPLVVHAIAADGTEVRCDAAECIGLIQAPVWGVGGEEIYFMRREGVNHLQRGLYAWRPETNALRTILKVDDLIEDCEQGMGKLVCLHESSISPRKIVVIDPSNGSIETLVDPNPEFHHFAMTLVEKLEWQGASGVDAAGHLVYPLGYEAGKRYPLVIVQYRSRGFLRGGTGDETPIHPLAANGFFVLSFDRPVKHDAAAMIGDFAEVERQNWGDDLWERTSALSALETIIDQLDDRGLIDRHRVGITGLSDGAETVWYAMIHSKYFAVASTSSGGWSPSWYYLLNRAMRERYFKRSAELSPPGMGGDDRWRRIAPEFHADTIDTPVLVQVSDHELVASAAVIGSLMDAGKPIDAYVFPNEYHVKWQPKHKSAVYYRTIDWLNFWLRGVEDSNPDKAAQYERWRALKRAKAESGP